MTTGPRINSEARAPCTFEIGLVLAGAVSAGAYTAGVIDYLLESLARFERYKTEHQDDPNCPRHIVLIRVISGASAGGITAALTAAALAGTPRSPQGLLHDTWVEDIDIADLLATKDLHDDDAEVVSLLDSTVLDVLAKRAFALNPKPRLPPYVADPLHLYLSVANLRGVPYMIAARGAQAVQGHQMTLHADYLHFALHDAAVGQPPNPASDEEPLARGTVGPSDRGWGRLAEAALATSAFPLGLKPRLLERPVTDYNVRLWPVPNEGAPCTVETRIPPNWGPGMPPEYRFLTVDGGLMNNEPLELARRQLAGPGGRNPRGPHEAHRAVILVDPFPDPSRVGATYTPRSNIVDVAKGMFGALVAQARFKPDELELAQREDVFSRYLISPVRCESDRSYTQPALRSAILGGFGGFLAHEFRQHDYELGRRNCERFLKEHFRLAADNPVFCSWLGDGFRKDMTVGGAVIPSLPILPIWPPGKEEVLLPARPTGAAVDMDRLKTLMDTRLGLVGKRLIARTLGGFLGGLGGVVWSLTLRGRVRGAMMEKIEVELARLT